MAIFTDLFQFACHTTEHLKLYPNWIIIAFIISGIMSGLPLIGSIFPISIFQFGLSSLAIKLGFNIFYIVIFLVPSLVLGDFIGYICGHYFNIKIKHWHFFKKRRIWFERSETIFQKYGGIAIVLARISGPLRTITPVVAGILNMTWLRFLFFDISAALFWCITHIGFGYIAVNPAIWREIPRFFHNICNCI